MQHFKVTSLTPFGVKVEPIHENTKISDIEIEELRDFFKQEQLVLLRGFIAFTNAQEFSDYCEKWGSISLWPFGKVLELVEQEKPEDHIFHNSHVPMHWDGMYRPQVPEYQFFHCVKAPLKGQGGRTTFSNTIHVLNNASSKTKELWSKVTGIYERQMEFYNSKTSSPLITKHPYRYFSVLRYNEPSSSDKGAFINPPIIKFTGIPHDKLNLFEQTLKEALYHPQNLYAHEWRDGDVVIADNFTLLHGREEFVSQTPRHLQRVQVLSNPPFNNPGLESYQ